MTTIEKRIVKLKALGAGDEECRQCLEISIVPMSCCRKCIARTQAFNSVMQYKAPRVMAAEAKAES